MRKTEVLGNEYDDRLIAAILVTLRELAGRTIDEQWTVAGSQEIKTLTTMIGAALITVETETYMGVSVSGEPEMVDNISELVRARLNKQP